MKKQIFVLVTAVLLVVFGTAAMGDDTGTYEKNGISLTYTEEFERSSTEGVFYPYPGGTYASYGIGLMYFDYFAMPADEFDALMEKDDDEWTDEDGELLYSAQGILYTVMSIDGGRGEAELREIYYESDEGEDFTEVGKAGDVTFFAVRKPETEEEYLAGIPTEYREEFIKMQQALLEVLKQGQYTEPVYTGSGLVGTTLSFEALDVNGNKVSSSDIFKENEITMINIWTTWCGNCKREMPELAEMHHRLAEKNVAVIGICMDADTELETCINLLEEYGVDFLNLQPFEGVEDMFEITGFPVSYFVDSEGTILSLPFEGAPADMSAYEERIDSLLGGGDADPVSTVPSPAAHEGIYRVTVTDTEGDPVSGAVIQFCSDTFCMMAKSDDNGIAEFEADKGVYTIHVLKAPEGYVSEGEEYTTEDSYCDICIVLQKES